MRGIFSFLNNEIVVNWVAPIICAVLGAKATNFFESRKKEGQIPKGGSKPGVQGGDKVYLPFSIRKIMKSGKVRAIVMGVLAFLVARALFSSGSGTGQPEDEPVLNANSEETGMTTEDGGDALTADKEEETHWTGDDGTEFYGNRKDGKIEGKGKAVYPNGEVYEGEFKAGLRDGSGTLSSSSGLVIYNGEWKDNVEEGRGTNYFYESNGRYEGEFKAGQQEGDGIYYWENGDRYEGKWENGIRNGMGVLIRADGTTSAEIWLKDEFVADLIWDAETWIGTDGTVYTGKKVNGEIEGYGRVVNSNGDIYLGELKGGNKDGKGICYFKNGNRYEGEWKNGKIDGFGIYCFKSSGDIYYGEFSNGQRDGTGTFYFSSGIRYEGEWEEDIYFGEGTIWYHPDDGLGRWYFEGEWTKDSRNGTLYYKDGTCETGIFQGDELVEVTGEMKGIQDQPDVVTWTDEDGTQYTGRQEEGVLEGKGIRINKDNEIYIGEFIGGMPNGNGTEYFKDGDYYVGAFADGKRNGKGVYYYSDEGKAKTWYCGEWTDGKRDGECEIKSFDDTSFYIGSYEDASFSGRGNMHYTTGVYYGEWQDGVRTGTGVFSHLDGSCYFGGYKDNQKSGSGVIYYIDGSRYEGEWADGKKNGVGTEYNADGSKRYGTWVDDEYQN